MKLESTCELTHSNGHSKELIEHNDTKKGLFRKPLPFVWVVELALFCDVHMERVQDP